MVENQPVYRFLVNVLNEVYLQVRKTVFMKKSYRKNGIIS